MKNNIKPIYMYNVNVYCTQTNGILFEATIIYTTGYLEKHLITGNMYSVCLFSVLLSIFLTSKTVLFSDHVSPSYCPLSLSYK